MNILLLGVGGFIGSNLAEHLLKETGHTVIGMDKDDEKVRDVDRQGGRFTFYQGDIGAAGEIVDELVEQSDVVVDLIAYANPSIYVSKPLEVVDLNFFQNLRLVDACMRHNKRLIQFSTCEVYGRSEGRREAFKEDETNLVMGPIKNQRWIYASAKELLERIIYAHGQEGDLDFTTIRPFNFVGPKIDYLVEAGSLGGPRVFSHFMSALIGGGPMRLVDGGSAHRSYTHISDASKAIQMVLENPEDCHNQIINIGNPGNGTTIRQLAYLMLELYEELTGERPRSWIEDIAGDAFYGAGYEDCDWRIPDMAKLNALGWQPSLDLRETFKQTIAWHLDELTSSEELPQFLQPAKVAV
ncbi:MAG TPA: bifunctional UDP-4-keto-pentose/UDP-xylose synthase [Dehalococcoidia bacterium]|nr:bifunctional UDP-4-keto-pentose/UDP-xylose synthase [Dehalococcoidia bacterium]